MESPAPTVWRTVPGGTPRRRHAPRSSRSSDPSPARETRMFRAPWAWRALAQERISSSLRESFPKRSPSSALLGLMRKGRQGSTPRSRSRAASTTVRTPRPSTRARMVRYTPPGSPAGRDPARTSTSPADRRSSFWSRASRAGGGMAGPWLLISVSPAPPPERIFTLTRVRPSSSHMKSVGIPRAFRPSSRALPVNPATKPRAVVSTPRLWRTVETLTPLPPKWRCSWLVRFRPPAWKPSTSTS